MMIVVSIYNIINGLFNLYYSIFFTIQFIKKLYILSKDIFSLILFNIIIYIIKTK
jgi:hypothetical protein